jgi:hypothetical protein
MGVFKPSSRRRGKKQQPRLKSAVPIDDENDLKAAALILLVESSAREKPLLTAIECMMHAGLPSNVASNRSFQQRVRRLASKLNMNHLLSSLDKVLQELSVSIRLSFVSSSTENG